MVVRERQVGRQRQRFLELFDSGERPVLIVICAPEQHVRLGIRGLQANHRLESLRGRGILILGEFHQRQIEMILGIARSKFDGAPEALPRLRVHAFFEERRAEQLMKRCRTRVLLDCALRFDHGYIQPPLVDQRANLVRQRVFTGLCRKRRGRQHDSKQNDSDFSTRAHRGMLIAALPRCQTKESGRASGRL